MCSNLSLVKPKSFSGKSKTKLSNQNYFQGGAQEKGFSDPRSCGGDQVKISKKDFGFFANINTCIYFFQNSSMIQIFKKIDVNFKCLLSMKKLKTQEYNSFGYFGPRLSKYEHHKAFLHLQTNSDEMCLETNFIHKLS